MCEVLYEDIKSGFWNYNKLKSKNNKYGNYLFSKFRYSNFQYIDRNSKEASTDEVAAIKILLRIGEKNKYKNLSQIVDMVGRDTLEFLFEKLLAKNPTGLKEFKRFTEHLLIENDEEELKNACKHATNALSEVVKVYPKESEVKKGSYVNDDYSNIVSSSAFRRLQDKAQVYSLEEHDFVRSRLTHSNEVAANCELICSGINFDGIFTPDDKENALLICRCAGLLHDIGNPPFGHYGEDLIKSFFADKINEESAFFVNKKLENDFIKFDGNAQALRIVTKLQYFSKKKSLNLPACVLGAIIKYPFCSTYDFKKPKFGYFISEKDDIAWLKTLGVYCEHVRNPFAVILEAADDISYITADLEDAIHKGLINFSSFKRLKYDKDPSEKRNEKIDSFYSKLEKIYHENVKKYLGISTEDKKPSPRAEETLPSYVEHSIFEKSMRPVIAKLRRELIVECAKQINKDSDKIFSQGLTIKDKDNYYELMKELKDYKELIGELKSIVNTVYTSNEVSKVEVSGSVIINTILNEYYNAFTSIKMIDYDKRKFTFDDTTKIAQNKYYAKILTYVSKDFIENFFWEMNRIESKSSYFEEYKKDFIEQEKEKTSENINIPEEDIQKNFKKDMEKFFLMHLLVDFVSGMTDSFANEIYKVLTNN